MYRQHGNMPTPPSETYKHDNKATRATALDQSPREATTFR